MKELINQVLIYIFSIIQAIRNKKKKNDSKKIIIVFSGVLGDSVMFLDALKSYIAYYDKKQNYDLTIIVKQGVYDFYKAAGLDMKNFLIIDLHKYVTDFKSFLAMNRMLKKEMYHMLIVPQMSISADIISANIVASQKITITNGSIKGPGSYKLVRKVVYTNCFIGERRLTELEKMRTLANFICKQHKSMEISEIEYQCESSRKYNFKYFVVFPLTSTCDRNWGQEKFAEVISYVWQMGYEIVISYENREKEKIEYLTNAFSDAPYVHIEDNLNMKELISIIANAELVIASDSGANHIAAALRIPTVCILGGRDDNGIFPYLSCGSLPYEPFYVMGERRTCFGCALGGEKIGSKNKVCRKRIRKNMSAMCVEEISTQKVIDVIYEIETAKKQKV